MFSYQRPIVPSFGFIEDQQEFVRDLFHPFGQNPHFVFEKKKTGIRSAMNNGNMLWFNHDMYIYIYINNPVGWYMYH